MIPLVSIGNFVSFIAYLIATLLAFISYRKRKIKFTLYFLINFILLAIWFFIISTPGLIFNDPKIVGLVLLFSCVLIYLPIANFFYIGLESLNLIALKKIILFLIPLFIVFTIFTGFKDLKPARLIVQGDFIYWLSQVKPIIRLLIGAVTFICGLIFSFSFLFHGIKSKEKKVLIRATIIVSGMIFLLLASVINFLAGATPSPLTLSFASFSAAVSAFLFVGGVLYKIE